MNFAGRVAIVTGAGGGLGRYYALLLAERGAAVVVNDLGGSSSGEGKSTAAADVIVEKIRKDGGKAVASFDSVENGEKIVQTALDNYGRIDIVINNAGILRDRSFVRMSDLDWDLVHQIHLRGSFILTRAAWPHFQKQKFGRVIMTSSVAGTYGNFGQANYGAAKMGLIGLSNTLAIEGEKYNIHSNVIVPMAASRLTEGLIPPDIFEELKPECIAPAVVWLCHEDCEETGGIYEAAGGWFGKFQWQRSLGAMLRRPGVKLTPELVRDSWNKIVDMKDALNLKNTQEAFGAIVDGMTNKDRLVPSKVAGSGIDPEVAMAQKIPPATYSYTGKDAILYALGIGVSTRDENHLQYLFEVNENFAAFPTFGIIPTQAALMANMMSGGIPGLQINLAQLVHGEQYLEVLEPLLSEDSLVSHTTIIDILDKGSGAAVIYEINSYRDKLHVLRAQFTSFLIGSGGFGGKRTSEKAVPSLPAPSRSPDKVVKVAIGEDQAALYRLSGDPNPLHIDPEFAAMGGFSRPILHGLCTFGITAKEVLKAFGGNSPKSFRAMKVRFSKPVYPGQTLIIEMWKEGSRVFVSCKAAETGEVVISGAYIDLNAARQSSSAGESEDPSAKPEADESTEFFKKVSDRVKSEPALCNQVNAIFLWNILKGGKPFTKWTLDMRVGQGSVYSGEPKGDKAQCTLTLEDADVAQLATGKLNPQKAFMSGKLKISGNVMLTRKLSALFSSQSKL